MKRCYYEILDVDKKATSSQVKQAYRKMALKYHPDKNSTQQGKKVFLEVQQAYDVLADPNERTFYDNNREKILFNKDQMSKQDMEQYSFGFNIFEFFTVKCFKGFGDEAGAFFSVYRDVFERIKSEQIKAYKSRDDLQEQMRTFEGFGTSATNVQKVLSFYEDWQNFTTYKTFMWTQQYDTRDAQNRWVKRRMQQENKKQRLKQKKTYIKTIKDLLSFVRKRDVRFQQHLVHLREQQERKQKEKIKKLQQKKKQKEDMKKIKQKLEEQRFREIEEYYKQNNAPQEKTEQCAYEEQDIPQFFCPICDKSFKSENQLDNHEKSKIHKQNVKLLQKQVMLPGQKIQQALKEDDQPVENNPTSPAKKKRFRKKKNKNNENQQQNNADEKEEEQVKVPEKKQPVKPVLIQTKNKKDSQSSDQEVKQPTKGNKNKKEQPPKNQKKEQPKVVKKQVSDQSSDDEDIFNTLAQNKNKKTVHENSDDQNKKKNKKGGNQKTNKLVEDNSEEQGTQEQKRLGKAKLKKMKKAEQQKQQKDNGLKCKGCGSVFPSKTKLFDHIKQTGHAAYK